MGKTVKLSLLLILATSLLFAGITLFNKSNNISPDSLTNSQVENGFNIYLDGWSAVVSPLGQWQYRVGSIDPISGGTNWQKLDFLPLSKNDIELIYKKDPYILKNNTSRLFSGSPNMDCKTNGCQIDQNNFSISELADIKKSKIYPVLSSWKVDSLLYRANISLPEGEEIIWVRNGLNPAFEIQAVRVPDPYSDLPAIPKTPYLATAFGITFTPWARWSDPGSEGSFTTPSLSDKIDQPNPEMLSAGLEGLSSTKVDLSALLPDRLTFLSSPTVGCDPTVLCSPIGGKSTFTPIREVQSIKICEISNEKADGVLLLSTLNFTYTFPNISHQAGLFKQTSPKYYPNRSIPIEPSFITGEKKIFIDRMIIIDGSNIVALWGGNADLSYETPPPTYLTAENLSTATSGRFKVCS
jgi:hypothetical protein